MGQPQLKKIIASFPRLPDYQLKYHQIYQFEGQFVQRVKETPFANSFFYNSQPSIFIEQVEPQLTFRMLVQPRLNTTKLFPYQQILKILQNCLSGLKQLKDRQFQFYGSISLDKIYYCKNINPIFNLKTNYQQAKLNIKFQFLSPQQLLALAQNSFQTESSFASDIFILGIVLLQVCTLTQSSQIYCPQTYNIFDLQIKNRLQKVSEYYPPQLVQILELCLEYDFQARISLEDILKDVKALRQRQTQQVTRQNIQSVSAQKNQNIPSINGQNMSAKNFQQFPPQNLHIMTAQNGQNTQKILGQNRQNLNPYPPGYNNNIISPQSNNINPSSFQTPKK